MARRLSAVFTAALIVAGCGGSAQPSASGTTSVLVMKHGRIVQEKYYGVKPTERLPVFSITKSVTSALIGIALARGDLRGIDEPLPWRNDVTLQQLLSMTAGYGRSLSFASSDPKTLASRARPISPGTFTYDSGSFDLAGDLLERATGMSLADYARRYLFGPMGIHDVRWPGGRGSSGLLLRPRELLAFGELYLEGGKHIVPASWVRDSTRAHVSVDRGPGDGYGYGWWIRPRSYAAHGYLGQVLTILPNLDEVKLVTSSRD
jgi:CubicO group peptidase (beta-lactamase class C family)